MVRSQHAPGLRVSELAREGGVGVETIRFYQRKGLLGKPDGSAPGNRHYSEQDVARLQFIRMAQKAGFTLAQIDELLALDRSDDRPRIRKLAEARIEELDLRIAELQLARRGLKNLVADCVRETEGPCPIITAFGA